MTKNIPFQNGMTALKLLNAITVKLKNFSPVGNGNRYFADNVAIHVANAPKRRKPTAFVKKQRELHAMSKRLYREGTRDQDRAMFEAQRGGA